MKRKSTLQVAAVLVLAAAALAGCASTKFTEEPEGQTGSLAIGQIRLATTGVPKASDASDVYTSGIALVLKKNRTGEQFTVYSQGSDGYFSFVPDADEYRLVKVALSASGTGYVWTFDRPYGAGDGVIFRIEKNKVNNLGVLESKSPFKGGDHTLNSGNHGEVKTWFEGSFPESGWKTREWVDVALEGGVNSVGETTFKQATVDSKLNKGSGAGRAL